MFKEERARERKRKRNTRKRTDVFMVNMKDSERQRQSNNVTKNQTSPLTIQPLKRHMKAIHGDQLGRASGYDGMVMTDTKQQIFSETQIKYLHA